MTVKRIVSNIEAENVDEVRKFYADLFDLDILMDMGWIVTMGTHETAVTQMSILSDGGSGAPVPDLSIEVDNVDAAYARANEIGCEVVRDLRDEPWGVRRFFTRDPTGKLLNVLSHRG